MPSGNQTVSRLFLNAVARNVSATPSNAGVTHDNTQLDLCMSIIAAALLVFATPALAASPKQDESIAVLSSQFRSFADAHGVEMKALKISQDIAAEIEGNGAAEGSTTRCTVSTQVSRPGESGIELSATGATCPHVIDLLQASIAGYAKPATTPP